MKIKTAEEQKTLRECGRLLAAVLQNVERALAPGISTLELDRIADDGVRSAGGDPVFKGYRTRSDESPFPGTICVSINDEIVHGIPRADRIVRSGDIVGIDIGMRHPRKTGLITDMAITVPVGDISPRLKTLLNGTRSSLERGISVLAPGIRMGDLGAAIQKALEEQKLGVVQELVGHGVGRSLHEDPYVPNYGTPGEGKIIQEGMVFAIEPMATLGSAVVVLDQDGWTWKTRDGSPAAHFEHTVAVTKTGAEILTRP